MKNLAEKMGKDIDVEKLRKDKPSALEDLEKVLNSYDQFDDKTVNNNEITKFVDEYASLGLQGAKRGKLILIRNAIAAGRKAAKTKAQSEAGSSAFGVSKTTVQSELPSSTVSTDNTSFPQVFIQNLESKGNVNIPSSDTPEVVDSEINQYIAPVVKYMQEIDFVNTRSDSKAGLSQAFDESQRLFINMLFPDATLPTEQQKEDIRTATLAGISSVMKAEITLDDIQSALTRASTDKAQQIMDAYTIVDVGGAGNCGPFSIIASLRDNFPLGVGMPDSWPGGIANIVSLPGRPDSDEAIEFRQEYKNYCVSKGLTVASNVTEPSYWFTEQDMQNISDWLNINVDVVQQVNTKDGKTMSITAEFTPSDTAATTIKMLNTGKTISLDSGEVVLDGQHYQLLTTNPEKFALPAPTDTISIETPTHAAEPKDEVKILKDALAYALQNLDVTTLPTVGNDHLRTIGGTKDSIVFKEVPGSTTVEVLTVGHGLSFSTFKGSDTYNLSYQIAMSLNSVPPEQKELREDIVGNIEKYYRDNGEVLPDNISRIKGASPNFPAPQPYVSKTASLNAAQAEAVRKAEVLYMGGVAPAAAKVMSNAGIDNATQQAIQSKWDATKYESNLDDKSKTVPTIPAVPPTKSGLTTSSLKTKVLTALGITPPILGKTVKPIKGMTVSTSADGSELKITLDDREIGDPGGLARPKDILDALLLAADEETEAAKKSKIMNAAGRLNDNWPDGPIVQDLVEYQTELSAPSTIGLFKPSGNNLPTATRLPARGAEVSNAASYKGYVERMVDHNNSKNLQKDPFGYCLSMWGDKPYSVEPLSAPVTSLVNKLMGTGRLHFYASDASGNKTQEKLLTSKWVFGSGMYKDVMSQSANRELAFKAMLHKADLEALALGGGTYTLTGISKQNVDAFLSAFDIVFPPGGLKHVFVAFDAKSQAVLQAHPRFSEYSTRFHGLNDVEKAEPMPQYYSPPPPPPPEPAPSPFLGSTGGARELEGAMTQTLEGIASDHKDDAAKAYKLKGGLAAEVAAKRANGKGVTPAHNAASSSGASSSQSEKPANVLGTPGKEDGHAAPPPKPGGS